MKTQIVALLALASLTSAVSIRVGKIDEQAEQDLDAIMNKWDDKEKPKPAANEVHVTSSKPKVSASEV